MMGKDKDVEVLLVEDSADDSEIVRHILEESHIRFLHVKDGADALHYIFSEPSQYEDIHSNISLVILDINLPKVNGLEVLQKIRTNSRTHNIPVVILSTSDDNREIAQAYKLGVNSFVIKPMKFEKFVSTVESISVYWLTVNRKSVN